MLVSSLVNVWDRGRFISVKHLLFVFTWDLALNSCSYYWDVCYSKVRVDCNNISIMQKVCMGNKLWYKKVHLTQVKTQQIYFV